MRLQDGEEETLRAHLLEPGCVTHHLRKSSQRPFRTASSALPGRTQMSWELTSPGSHCRMCQRGVGLLPESAPSKLPPDHTKARRPFLFFLVQLVNLGSEGKCSAIYSPCRHTCLHTWIIYVLWVLPSPLVLENRVPAQRCGAFTGCHVVQRAQWTERGFAGVWRPPIRAAKGTLIPGAFEPFHGPCPLLLSAQLGFRGGSFHFFPSPLPQRVSCSGGWDFHENLPFFRQTYQATLVAIPWWRRIMLFGISPF